MEFVKQATKTSRDNCASILIMRNKKSDEKAVGRTGNSHAPRRDYRVQGGSHGVVPAPTAQRLRGKAQLYQLRQGHYGFFLHSSEENFEKAWNIAFKNSQEVLLEEYIPGDDYRFLVIGNVVQAVSKRIPAYVVGDGVRTIRDLVIEKSNDPRRGPDHKRPLSFIGMGAEEALHLRPWA